ncbi:hypothetical protein GHT06_019073 [Daphnia sinensis]|uniref:Uncharacterized protein n=1 Tax=Daphnia sinensis TaxID=1820382 RepID=A0AAD5L221_9CRUS|nr:hypothetical protein GHT06_019073 [Daphnia sinensis]
MDDLCLSKYKKRKMNITLATEEVEKLYKVSTKTRKTKQRNENIDGTIIINRTEPEIMAGTLNAGTSQVTTLCSILESTSTLTTREEKVMQEKEISCVIGPDSPGRLNNSLSPVNECFVAYQDLDEEYCALHEVHPHIYLPILCVAFYLRHHLTKTALHDHLRILSIGTDSIVKKLTSQHNLLSQYSNLKNEVSKIFNKNIPQENQPRGHKFRASNTPCYVLRMPIEKQIRYFIERYAVSHENWDPNFRGGVQSGGCYRELTDQGLIDEKTITVMWNTDGANPQKKKQKSVLAFHGLIWARLEREGIFSKDVTPIIKTLKPIFMFFTFS